MNINTGYTNTDDTNSATNTVHTNIDKNTDTNRVDTNTATNTSCIFCIGRPWAAAAPGHHSFSLPRHLTLIDNGITNTIIFSTIILNIINEHVNRVIVIKSIITNTNLTLGLLNEK